MDNTVQRKKSRDIFSKTGDWYRSLTILKHNLVSSSEQPTKNYKATIG